MGMTKGRSGSHPADTAAVRDTGVKCTLRQMNFRLSLCRKVPGRSPASHRIWNPLHTPNTRPPPLAKDTTSSMMGEKRAMAPLRR